MQENSVEHFDYFISYNHRDEEWAVWIASKLEEAGKHTIIQAWDFRAGSNFILEMQRATAKSDRTIVVLSKNYLDSEYTQPEWAAVFASDPQGSKRLLVPVRIEPCEPDGLLKQIVYIDLAGMHNEKVAARKLLAELEPGRALPLAPPPFPGTAVGPTTKPMLHNSAPERMRWRPIEQELNILWRDIILKSGGHSTPTVELHFVPLINQRLEVRRLLGLPSELTSIGRQRGIFSATEAVETYSDDQVAAVFADDKHDEAPGILVSRDGQRGIWFLLPHDDMGSVFDPEDLKPRIEATIETMMSLPLDPPDDVGIALALGPLTLLTSGNVNILGHRNNTTLPYTMHSPIQQAPKEAIPFSALRTNTSDVAEEIVARLEVALRKD